MDQFFCVIKNYPKRKNGIMVNIIKEELPIEESFIKKNQVMASQSQKKILDEIGCVVSELWSSINLGLYEEKDNYKR